MAAKRTRVLTMMATASLDRLLVQALWKMSVHMSVLQNIPEARSADYQRSGLVKFKADGCKIVQELIEVVQPATGRNIPSGKQFRRHGCNCIPWNSSCVVGTDWPPCQTPCQHWSHS